MERIFNNILDSRSFYKGSGVSHDIISEEVSLSPNDSNLLIIKANINTKMKNYKMINSIVTNLIKIKAVINMDMQFEFDKTLNLVKYDMKPTEERIFHCYGTLLFSSSGDLLVNNLELIFDEEYKTKTNSFLQEKLKKAFETHLDSDIKKIFQSKKL